MLTRHRGFLLVLNVLLAVSAVRLQAQSDSVLERLTVPKFRLPPGCELSPSKFVHEANGQVRAGLWADLPIPGNPWRGSDRPIVATLSEAVTTPPRMPDGPPLSRAEMVRFRLAQADDVDEAYAAIYLEDGTTIVTVVALTFTETAFTAVERRKPRSPEQVRFMRDRTAIVVSGSRGRCFESVASYLRELLVR
jgi:hypothetical protein